MNNLKKNDIFTAVADGWSSDGAGVFHADGRAVFVPGVIPGEEWTVKILKATSAAVYGKGTQLLSPSPERREAECKFAAACGGCSLWHMSYAEELRFKLSQVNSALRHVGGQSFEITEIIGGDSFTRYRNKAIYNLAETPAGPAAGFYRPRSHELVPVDGCLIQNELADRAAQAVVGWLRDNKVAAYDEKTGRGSVRHVFVRRAFHGEGAVLCVVSARGFGAQTEAFAAVMRKACPELTGIVLNINKTRGNTVLAGDFHTLWGEANIRDTLCGFEFELAPQAFYQINPPQAERLYERAVEYAAPAKEDTVIDLYCGAGTISMCLARRAGRVIGAELVPQAVENARENAKRNCVENAEFICADAGEAAQHLAKGGLSPAVVVIDPPRKGMSELAVKEVCAMHPERIVYVSCNPATLARDIKQMTGFGYKLTKAAAVDMFPRTAHIETVALLERA